MRVIVIGGSIGGIMSGLALRQAGIEAEIFERLPSRLAETGAGIRLQQPMIDLIRDRVGLDLAQFCTTTTRLRYLGADNAVLHEEGEAGHFISWGVLYRSLLRHFPDAQYHLGETAVDVGTTATEATVRFESGLSRSADLVAFAEGIGSHGRRFVDADAVPRYAGYVVWRGMVPEQEVSEASRQVLAEAATYVLLPYSHIIVYPVPSHDGGSEVGRRMFNFVWYRNLREGAEFDAVMHDRQGQARPFSLPPDEVPDDALAAFRHDADTLLPPAVREVVARTAKPFIQTIYDLESQRMVRGRACLIGDGAFAARPHAGAGTGKAALNACALADALAGCGGDIDGALAAWEHKQLAFGRDLVAWARTMGDRSQVHNNWDPRDPNLHFGLHPPGSVGQPTEGGAPALPGAPT